MHSSFKKPSLTAPFSFQQGQPPPTEHMLCTQWGLGLLQQLALREIPRAGVQPQGWEPLGGALSLPRGLTGPGARLSATVWRCCRRATTSWFPAASACGRECEEGAAARELTSSQPTNPSTPTHQGAQHTGPHFSAMSSGPRAGPGLEGGHPLGS